jgi:hypothetical protein
MVVGRLVSSLFCICCGLVFVDVGDFVISINVFMIVGRYLLVYTKGLGTTDNNNDDDDALLSSSSSWSLSFSTTVRLIMTDAVVGNNDEWVG